MSKYSTIFLILFSISFQFLEVYSTLHSTIESANCYDKKQNINNGPHTQKAGWVDPFDMGGGNDYSYKEHNVISHENIIIDPLKLGWKDTYQEERYGDFNKRQHSLNSQKFIIYQRFINVFLKAIALKDTPEIIGSKLVQLDLIINEHDLKLLQSYGNNGEQTGKVEIVSEVINKIFMQSKLKSASVEQSLTKIVQWFSKATVKVISSPEWTIATSMLLMMFLVIWLVFVTRSYRMATFCFFFTIFIAGFGFNWMRMYEEQEIARFYDRVVYGDAPAHCKGETLAWYNSIYYYWFGEDCLKFYKKRDVRPIVKISPTDVLSVTLSSMFIEPANNIGKAYGNFISGIIKHVPWYLTPIAFPFAFITPFFILVFIFKYQLSLSLTGIHFMPSWAQPIGYKQHSKYIEDLSNRTNKSCDSKGDVQAVLSDCKKPLYLLMNFPAVNSVLSNFKNVGTVDDKSEVDPNVVTKVRDEEKVDDSMQIATTSKCDSCRKRTIYTSTSGSSPKSNADEIKIIAGSLSGGAGEQNTVDELDEKKCD